MKRIALVVSLSALISADGEAQQQQYKMTTPIPESITTPPNVETRIGTLEFLDGVPTPETTQKAYDQLDHSTFGPPSRIGVR